MHTIYSKLEAFYKKYYTNKLLKGILFFLGIGLLYFIFTALLEYFLWLPSSARTILFWVFIAVQGFFIYRFILEPLFYLFKIRKGISYDFSSKIIGNHFLEVADKLSNFLQLDAISQSDSDLVQAAISQKSKDLQPIPFLNAIDFKKNIKYIPLAILPFLLLALFFVFGKGEVISSGFSRVVQYEKQFEKPASFQFELLNSSLIVEQGKPFTFQVSTKGEIAPSAVSVIIDDAPFLLQSNDKGIFTFTIDQVYKPLSFYFSANEVNSKTFKLNIASTPSIDDFSMVLNYPSYTKRPNELVKGSGNAIVPVGTTISWSITSPFATSIVLDNASKITNFVGKAGVFKSSKTVGSDFDYSIITSNKAFKNYESLDYSIKTIQDAYPTISVVTAPDSLKLDATFYLGAVSDDYGIQKVDVVYYDINKPSVLFRKRIASPANLDARFTYSFPSGLNLTEGSKYEFYFEVTDNDVPNNFKSSKTNSFKFYQATETEKEDANFMEQRNSISSLSSTLKENKKELDKFSELDKLQKEKDKLSFQDKKKIDDFIEKQKEQNRMIDAFSKKLSNQIEKTATTPDFKQKELERRLEVSEKEALKNEKLLKELEKIQDKLSKDDLFDKLDKNKQQSKSQTKSLEQLVELTKRFYVEKKLEQVADKFEKLADKQEALSKKENDTSTDQKEIDKELEELSKELEELKKDNDGLKKPMDIEDTKPFEEAIKKDSDQAKKEMDNNKSSEANKKQKAASDKMKKMGSSLSGSSQKAQQEQMQEDQKMIRQILDNMMYFSFNEEKLLNKTSNFKSNTSFTSEVLKKQQELKMLFKHVDDSLFAVSLRNPFISEVILEHVSEVHYNVDKALEFIADSNYPKGASHQQYVLKGANTLADMLSTASDQMNMQGSGGGSGTPSPGQGSGGQLPDIIKKQGELGDKMKDNKPGEKPGESGKPGDSGKPGKSGERGEQGEGGEGGNGDAAKTLQIIKEQQQLRNRLEEELKRQGVPSGFGNEVLDDMKELEKQLINKGMSPQAIQQATQLKHELLKLQTALKEQGEDTERKSNSNNKSFSGKEGVLPQTLIDYLQNIEILKRQQLPLQPEYKNKVNKYFNQND